MTEKANIIKTRLASLRQEMKQHGIDMYLIGSRDFHGSEYVGDHFRCREYISGFTGSAGSVLVTEDAAGLWTDGRYYIQAEKELSGTEITLFRSGEEDVPDIPEYIEKHIKKGQCLGFDGRTVSAKDGEGYVKRLEKKWARVDSSYDLAGMIWEGRPGLPEDPAWLLEDIYSGESARQRLDKVRLKMKEYGADHHVLTSLDDIAWLLNIRGNDIRCNPVVLAYLIMDMDSVSLYVMESKFNEADILKLNSYGVSLKPYDDFYEDLKKLTGCRILLDMDRVNYYAVNCLSGAKLIDKMNPSLLLKAVKNETELKNIRNAHLMDGIALTRFMYWLKTHIGKEEITEISAADKMESFRKEMPGYTMPSFEPVSAYKENAALPHYSASPDNNAAVQSSGLLLMDTGGQYMGTFTGKDSGLTEYACGTTDITRTFVCGPLTEDEKTYFTLVLAGHLNLAAARFKRGVKGTGLDYLARQPLWERGVDYNHGTGHGVGYLLNVHESPNSFRYRTLPDRASDCVITEGMVTSDEPGVYFEGRFGIRHENLIESVSDGKNEYGEFLHFEYLTLVPFDPDGIDESLLTDREKELLAEYQIKVYNAVSPYLNTDERAWLKEVCKANEKNIP